MLNEADILWLVDIAGSAVSKGQGSLPIDVPAAEAMDRFAEIKKKLAEPVEPLELLIFCPVCKTQHIDVGKYAIEAHKRHSCQGCGLLFSVTKDVPNIGVKFFKGCRDSDHTVKLWSSVGSSPYFSYPPLRPGEELVVRIGEEVNVFKGPTRQ